MKKRILGIVLTLCMVLSFVPTTAFAEGETGSTQNVTAFATKDQLMNSFIRNPEETHITTGKVVFGKNYKGKAQEWLILGKDPELPGDNIMIFATSSLTEKLKFRNEIENNIPYDPTWGCEYVSDPPETVLANHYGSSDLRAALKNIAADTSYFTTAEQSMMNTTKVPTPTFSFSSSTPEYYISDKLYAPGVVGHWGGYLVFIGSDGWGPLHEEYAYNGDYEQYWSRDFDSQNATTLYVVDCGAKGVFKELFISAHYVRPASNLDLSSVLFASAAEASSDGIAVGTIESGKAMSLRLDGSDKYVGSVSYDANSGVIKAYRTSWLDNTTVSLVVQGNDGTKDWYYSMPVSGVSETLSTIVSKEQIASACGVSDLSLADCKIWLEKTDSDERITYAVMAEEKEIPAYRIEDITLLGMTPTPENAFREKPTCITSWIASSNITYTTSTDGREAVVTGTADWNTTYKATVTIRTIGYNSDPRVFASNVSVKIDGKRLPNCVSPNADGTLTITQEFTTEKRKSITSIAPSVPAGNTFTTYYGYDGYEALPINGSELGAQVTAAVLDKSDNTTKNETLNVTWSVANANDTNYDKTPGATNTFQWTIPASVLADYDTANCPGYDASTGTITGTVSITNKAATPVTITGTDSAVEYTGTDIDVSQYFTIDSKAGTPTYSLIAGAEGVTGEGTLSGSKLSVIKNGIFKIKLSTAANGVYSAGEKSITLTVDNGTIQYEVSDFSGSYDGKTHSIGVNVSAPSNTVVTYSTDGINYGIGNPSFTDAGTYIVNYRIQKNNYDTVEGSKTVSIMKKPVTITANEQSIMWGNHIDQSAYFVSEDGFATGDRIAAITLTPSTAELTDDGTISISGVKIENTAGSNVTENYDLTVVNGTLEITHNTSLAPNRIDAVKTKTSYMVGETLNVDDIIVTACYADGYSENVTDYTTNAADIDMFKAEKKTLTVSCFKNNGTQTANIAITVLDEHIDETTDHICDVCGSKISEHAGGEASCMDKAVCDYCGNEYGEVDSSNHNLEKISAKDATVTEIGNKEYWHCKDCGKYFADENGTNEIEYDDTVTSKLPPEIIDGKGQSITAGEKEELTFRSNAAIGDFIRVEIDGQTLDEKNYTVKEGSTIITLKADYLETLSAGEHTIEIISKSGTAATTFTVGAKTADNHNSTQTGDNSMMWPWASLALISSGVLIAEAVVSKKKKQPTK